MKMWFRFMLPIMRRFRLARARQVAALFPDIGRRAVCDLGGSLTFWKMVGGELTPKAVTILNVGLNHSVYSPGDEAGADTKVVIYDGRIIPFGDGEVDILLCNSVIEHVPVEQRAGLVSEIKRVARNYVIQTPAREFPIEPHFVAPALHWLPRGLARRLVMLTPYALMQKFGPDMVRGYFDEIRLLSRADIRALFPGDVVMTERVLGLPKSFTVVRRQAA